MKELRGPAPEPLSDQLRRARLRRSDREILVALAWTLGLAGLAWLVLGLFALPGWQRLLFALVLGFGAVGAYAELRPVWDDLRAITRPSTRRRQKDRDSAG